MTNTPQLTDEMIQAMAFEIAKNYLKNNSRSESGILKDVEAMSYEMYNAYEKAYNYLIHKREMSNNLNDGAKSLIAPFG